VATIPFAEIVIMITPNLMVQLGDEGLLGLRALSNARGADLGPFWGSGKHIITRQKSGCWRSAARV